MKERKMKIIELAAVFIHGKAGRRGFTIPSIKDAIKEFLEVELTEDFSSWVHKQVTIEEQNNGR